MARYMHSSRAATVIKTIAICRGGTQRNWKQ